MKIDILYKQLHNIIESQRFSERMVLAMGSAYNVRLMQDYLKCYSLKLQAILDNNPTLSGTVINGCKVFRPEEILLPQKDKVLILVYSPNYNLQIKDQLESYGYEEKKHFFLIQDFRTPMDNWKTFVSKCKEAKRGLAIYKRIQKEYGKDSHIFITRGATGDVFFNGLYLKEYTQKIGIQSFVLAGDAKALKKIAALFGMHQTVPLTFQDAEALQQCYKFFGLKGITDIFMWQGSLYLNRCRTRMRKEFTFLDTYTHYIYHNMVERKDWNLPGFKKMDAQLEEKYTKQGVIEGKTVIMAPFAYSVKNIPVWVWDEIALGLQEKGYRVFANINSEMEINPFKNIESIFFPFEESEALLTYAGSFLALRSGLCDIVAMIPCKQVLLYPEEMNPIDYNVHRSDAIFSGFALMGYNVDNIVEISSPMIQDLACPYELVYDENAQKAMYEELIGEVLAQF